MALTPEDIAEVRRLARLEAHAYHAAVSDPLYPTARTAFDTNTGRFNVPTSWPINGHLDAVDAAAGGNPFA